MTRTILILFVFVFSHFSIYGNYTIIEIPTISTTSTFSQTKTHIAGPFMQSIVPGHIIAVKHINDRVDILPNHKLKLAQSVDCGQNPLNALRKAIEVVQDSIHSCNSDLNNQSTIINSPIVLCCPWSAFSEVTAPIFEEFGRIQISTSSSANSLSESQSFFRTIPNADSVVKAYIPLCKYFGWNKIAIVYINDAYGVDHKDEIEIQAKEADIDVEEISFEYGITNNITTSEESIKQAADLIKKLELYIIIIISISADLSFVLHQFKENNILEYPYYYMFGITKNSIKTQGLGNLTQGFLSVQPFFPALATKQQYVDFNVSGGSLTIWEISKTVYSALERDWLEYYNTDPSMVYYASEPHDYTAWGYDSLYTSALTLNYLIESKFNLFDYNATKLIEAIKYYLKNELSFIGATGLVEMDKNGDRLHGDYMYGYINNDGEFEPIGVFGSDRSINIDVDVVFPIYFNGKSSEIPLSEPFTYVTSITVNGSVYWSVIILCITFIVAILICIILVCKERKHPIIAKSSYKLSIIISFGCILGLLLVATQRTGDFGCVVTWYGYSAVFTLIFMPIFARLYRLHIIMHRNNVEFTLIEQEERKLNKGIFAMFLLDVVLLAILAGIHFVNGNITTLRFIQDDAIRSKTDPLLITQNEYESCQINNIQVSTAFDVLIIVYKLIQFGFGMYFFLSIFRLKYQTPINDEISAVLLSIVLSIIIFVIIITFGLANSNSEDITKKYVLNSVMILLLIIFIMLLNVFLRLYYRYKFRNNAQQYAKSPEEIMRDEFEVLSDGGDDGSDKDETQLYSHKLDSAQILGSTNINIEDTVSLKYVQPDEVNKEDA